MELTARPRKIAFYMTTILEHGGGIEKYYIETAGHLSRMPGVQADVITMDDQFTARILQLLSLFYGRKLDPKLSHKLTPSSIKQRLAPAQYHKAHSFAQLRQLLKQYDVVYSKNELLEAFLWRFIIGYHELPPVLFGGHTPLHYPRARSFHAKLHNVLYSGPLYRWLASGVKRFQALNTYEYQLYRRLFPGRKVYKIYNPFDAEAYRASTGPGAKPASTDPVGAGPAGAGAKTKTPTSGQSRQTSASGQRSPQSPQPSSGLKRLNILWVGRLTEQKGVEQLRQLVDSLPESSQAGLSWHVYGDGEQRDVVEALAARHANFEWHGYADPASMPQVYRSADLLVSTSLWEGYPYFLLEARALNLPVVAFEIPGVSDILTSYGRGRLVHDLDGMREAIQSYSAWALAPAVNKPDASGQAASDQFEPNHIYRQLLDALGD